MEPTPTASAKPSRLDSFLRGPAVALLSLILFGEVNYIAARHYARADLTSERRFTLSSRSREIVRGLRAPTELYVLLTRDEEHYAEVSALAERYAAESRRLEVHYIDPDRQRDRLIGLAQQFHLQLLQNREGDRTVASAGILAAQGSRHWEVARETLRELGRQDPGDEQGISRVLNAQITVERAVSEALLHVDRAEATHLCFSSGHAEMPIAQGERGGAGLAEDLRHHNFQVREVEVHGRNGVPSDCDGLIIAGPQRAWSDEDAQAVERYLRAGGNVALFIDLVVLEGQVAPTGLERVVRLAGMALPAAATVEIDADHLVRENAHGQFRADAWNEHELTRDLRGSSLMVELVRPITRAEGAETVPSSLLQTSTQAWGETSIRELGARGPERDAADVPGPIQIAMAGEVPGAARRSPEMPGGRLVVVGTSLMLEDGYFSPAARATFSNAVFAEAVAGWITARRELVNIPSRPISRAALLVSPRDLLQIGLYVILLVPLAVALVGVAVWRAEVVVRRTGIARYRTTLALAGLVLGGAAFIWFDRYSATTDELEARRQNVFRAFHRDRVSRIEVEHSSGRFELVRERDAWFVVSNGQRRPADLLEAERLLSEIEGAESQRALGDLDATSRQRFGLERPRAKVVVHEGNEVTARFSLGGAVEQEDAVYVEASAATGGRDARARALVLPKSFGQPFDRAAVEFRDRRIAEVDVDRLERIEFTVAAGRRVLERRGAVWTMTTPALGRASRSAVETVTAELRDFRATRVLADDVDAATLRLHGLDAPSLRVEVRRASGAEPIVLRVGAACPGHDDEYTAVREGTGTLVCVGRSFADGFRAPPEGFRDDHVLSARTDEVSEVRVKGAGTAGADLVLRRDGSAWRADNSPNTVDAEAIEAWLTALHDLSTPARLEGDLRATHGLAPAQTVIEVKRTGVEGVERVLVGSLDAQGLYVSRDDEALVMQFAPSAVETLRVEPVRFRPRTVLEETDDQLRAMVIDAGPLHEEIARLDGTLRLTRPVEIVADPSLTSDLAHGIATLTADRWVSSTLQPQFGLAPPRARVVARFEGAPANADAGAIGPVRSYTLAFGASAPGGGVYATLEGQVGVFVVPRALFEQASAAHLDRGALRIARESVTRFTLTTGGATPARIALVKTGDDWRTEAGTTADGARVDALLNQLASVTAVRVFGYGPPTPEMRFATPTMVLEFAGAGDAGQQSLRIVVGDRFGSGEGAGFYARRDGLDATLSLPESLVETLQQYRP